MLKILIASMKKVKISKHMKTKAEKILVIGSCGSGIESSAGCCADA